jgi:hypothetical protein
MKFLILCKVLFNSKRGAKNPNYQHEKGRITKHQAKQSTTNDAKKLRQWYLLQPKHDAR